MCIERGFCKTHIMLKERIGKSNYDLFKIIACKTLFKKFNKENVSKYIEYTNEKVSIEEESQFELGFKIAIKIIFQALK